jgi:hypothetical protein
MGLARPGSKPEGRRREAAASTRAPPKGNAQKRKNEIRNVHRFGHGCIGGTERSPGVQSVPSSVPLQFRGQPIEFALECCFPPGGFGPEHALQPREVQP